MITAPFTYSRDRTHTTNTTNVAQSMLYSQPFDMYIPVTTYKMWIAILVFFHIANNGSAYRIVSMGSAIDEVKTKLTSTQTFAIITLSNEQSKSLVQLKS